MYVIIIYSLIVTILLLHAFYYIADCSVVTKQIESHLVIFLSIFNDMVIFIFILLYKQLQEKQSSLSHIL